MKFRYGLLVLGLGLVLWLSACVPTAPFERVRARFTTPNGDRCIVYEDLWGNGHPRHRHEPTLSDPQAIHTTYNWNGVYCRPGVKK